MTRTAISESLHSGLLADIRQLLSEVLKERERIAVLIDNLDKAWVRDENLEDLSQLIFGLLGAATKIPAEFSKSGGRRNALNVTLAVFLRSDIFQYVSRTARERDKLSFSRIAWEDRTLLMRLLDERLIASGNSSAEIVWRRYFTPTVGNESIREYLASVTLPRPRDLLYLVKAAVDTAINRNHTVVTEADFNAAEKQYSRYALDSIETEAMVAIPEASDLLYEFVGCNEVLELSELEGFMQKAGIERERFESTMHFLLAFSFLGLEVRPEDFSFAADEDDLRKHFVLARNLQDELGKTARYEVHRAFHSYLEVRSQMRH